MIWSLEIDRKPQTLPRPGGLRAVIEATSPREVSLELGSARLVPWFERLFYRALGLRVADTSPVGGLHVLLASDLALVNYDVDDDDCLVGVESPPPSESRGSVTFTLPNGETLSEPRAHCLARSKALLLLDDFYASGQRPVGVLWISRLRAAPPNNALQRTRFARR